MNISDFLNQNSHIVAIALFIIGLFLKKTPHIKNWLIPYILSILGIITCNLISTPGIDATLQGILATGIAVYSHQLYKTGSSFLNDTKTHKTNP